MKNATEICIVLDRSGSMDVLRDKTIESFNSFIKDQKVIPGEAYVSLIQFDDSYEPNYYHKELSLVDYLTRDTYQPRGMTKLYDAIGKTINDLGERLRNISENNRPDKVLFIIITDGQENSSREFQWETIKKMIDHQTDKYNWKFLYLGANQDAMAEAGKIGIGLTGTVTYDQTVKGTNALFAAVSDFTVAYRSGKPTDTMSNYYNQALAEEEDKK